MEIAVIIDLLDHEGTRHNGATLKFTHEATIEDLKKKINSLWQIDQDYQHLYYNGNEIRSLTSTLQQIGIKNEDVVVVKHALLPTWTALLKRANTFKEARTEDEKKVIYDGCQKFVKQLDNGNFCSIYPDFAEKFDKIVRMLTTHYDRVRGAIENSARIYFENLYHERNPTIKFASRSKGSRRGCICIVEVENTTIKYYIKTHHGGGARDSCTRADLDLKEFLVYRILQELGVGPEIHFVPHDGGSRWILYIASREIPSFKTIEEVESSEVEDLSKYAKAVVQMLCLYTVLNMADHHLANMGVDSHGSPFIVDFFLIERRSFDVKIDYYDKVRQTDKINKVLGTFQERLEIGKNYLKESNFVRKVDETLERFLIENERIFEEKKPHFDRKEKTNDLIQYVRTVKENDLSLSDKGLGSTIDEEEVQSILNDDEMEDFKEEQNINKGKMCLKRAREDAHIKKMEDKINLNTQKLTSEQQLLEMKRGKDLEPRNCHRALAIYAAPKTPHYKENKNLEVKKTIEKKQKRLHYLHMMDKMKKAKKDLE